MNGVPNVVSVDVEDWYQSCIDYSAGISDRCRESTSICLGLLDRAEVKGTFFVQGLVAEQMPDIVRSIDAAGHDVQTHGHSHKPVNRLGPEGFREDLKRAKGLIEDITGKPVTGFRAPDFTIDSESMWAFDVMAELGFTFDSSVFPMRTRRYGVSGFEPGYSKLDCKGGRSVEELPVAVVEASGVRLPVGGGGYFRLLPTSALKWALGRTSSEGRPFVIYCHPYDFNPREWDNMPGGFSYFYRLHQSIGRGGFSGKLETLLGLGRFGTMVEALDYCRGVRTGI